MKLPCEECLVRASCYNRVHKIASILTKRLFVPYIRANCSILQKFYWDSINECVDNVHPLDYKPCEMNDAFEEALMKQFKIKIRKI